MAEKGILVADAASGESIACRDAYEQDDDTNSRIVQLIDKSQRHHGFDRAAFTGRVREIYDTTDSDDTDLSTVPSDILTNALTCGDKTTLVVGGYYAVTDDTEIITITPIVIDDDNAAVGFLTPKTFSSFKPDGGTVITEAFHWKSGTDPVNFAEILSWNVLGAHKVGIHVATSATDGKFSGSVSVFAEMITGPAFDIPAATRKTAGAYASEAISGGGGE